MGIPRGVDAIVCNFLGCLYRGFSLLITEKPHPSPSRGGQSKAQSTRLSKGFILVKSLVFLR